MRQIKGRHLFIDNELIAKSNDITFTVNPPVKAGRIFKADRLWEAKSASGYATVLDNEECRLYYGSTDSKKRKFLCLATSKDGIKWEKPNLGIFNYNGSKRNNILFEGVISGTVFIEPHGKPKERYKYLTSEHQRGAEIYVSPDGLHFRKLRVKLSPFYLDNQICAFWDERINKYVVYMRGWAPPNKDYKWMGFREIARAEVDDIAKPWPYNKSVGPTYNFGRQQLPVIRREFPRILGKDKQDPPTVDLYNINAVNYPYAQDVYLGFPSAYYRYPFPPEGQYVNNGVYEVQLAVSRDGIKWHRYRTPYVRRGIEGELDSAMTYMMSGMVSRGNYIYQYYTGRIWRHCQGRLGLKENEPEVARRKPNQSLGLGRLVQRLDGFVSVDATYTGGSLTTKPFVFKGNSLTLNIDTSAMGTARVGIYDKNNKPIPGYSIGECDVIQGNYVKKEVGWKNSADVSSLAGKPVRIYFEMRATKLYGFEFV